MQTILEGRPVAVDIDPGPFGYSYYGKFMQFQTSLSDIVLEDGGSIMIDPASYNEADNFDNFNTAHRLSGPRQMVDYHVMLLTGFFFYDGRLGFEVYDPASWNGQGTFIWECDLKVQSGFIGKGNAICAESFSIPEKAESSLQKIPLNMVDTSDVLYTSA